MLGQRLGNRTIAVSTEEAERSHEVQLRVQSQSRPRIMARQESDAVGNDAFECAGLGLDLTFPRLGHAHPERPHLQAQHREHYAQAP